MVYNVFHISDNLAASLATMKTWLPRPMEYIVNMHLQIQAFHLESSQEFECGDVPVDDCVARLRLEVNTTCALPWENATQLQLPICTDYLQGLNATKLVSNLYTQCKQSCIQINVHTQENPLNYLVAICRQVFIQGMRNLFNYRTAYYVYLPPFARLITSEHNYLLASYIADFGGWSGIFIGISVTGIISTILGMISDKFKLKKFVFPTLMFVFACCLFGLMILFTLKFVKSPIATTVDFEETRPDFCITVCASPFIFEISKNDAATGITKKYC